MAFVRPLLFGSLLLMLLGCSVAPHEPAPSSTSEPLTTRLPYAYDEGGVRVTVIEVVPALKSHGITVPAGYRQWTVNFRYENLTNQDYEPPSKGFGGGHCVGLTSLKLKTNQGNTYKPRFVGGSPFCLSLRPKAAYMQEELYIFEIRIEEVPVELAGYDLRAGSAEHLVFIFALEGRR